jgi:hypothetical protein
VICFFTDCCWKSELPLTEESEALFSRIFSALRYRKKLLFLLLLLCWPGLSLALIDLEWEPESSLLPLESDNSDDSDDEFSLEFNGSITPELGS